jgi:hypothetical protein
MHGAAIRTFSLQIIRHNIWIFYLNIKQIIYIKNFTKMLSYVLGLVLKNNYGYPDQQNA